MIVATLRSSFHRTHRSRACRPVDGDILKHDRGSLTRLLVPNSPGHCLQLLSPDSKALIPSTTTATTATTRRTHGIDASKALYSLLATRHVRFASTVPRPRRSHDQDFLTVVAGHYGGDHLVRLVLDQGDDHAVQVEEEHDKVEAELEKGFLCCRVSTSISTPRLLVRHTFLCTFSFRKISVASSRWVLSTILLGHNQHNSL